MTEFVMPSLGADMEAGILVAWRKQPGDAVTRGEIIAEVETDKGLIEVEIFTSGTVEKLLVEAGAKVPVGTVLALIRDAAPPREPAPRSAAPAPSVPVAPVPPAPGPAASGVAPTAHRRVSPAARKLAAELDIDVERVHGTGPGGAVQREDVARAAAERPGPAPPPVTSGAERAARMRAVIAAAMARSKREIPHYYLATTIDLERVMRWLVERNGARPVGERLVPAVLLLKAVALALREVPELNAVWSGAGATLREDVHVGVAIALRGGGLVVPALHHADRQPIDALMAAFRDLVTRARAGSLRSSELTDATVTVTSLGEQGVESVLGIIYPPQVAIVGFGTVVERPWVDGGAVVPRRVVTASLAADHRVSDGHRGGLFLAAVSRCLQMPEKL
jgi:pyruvate dehydrogenase E2 component (dihydrolipoamide acetyltransferase)